VLTLVSRYQGEDNMVKVQAGEQNFYMDGYLKSNLDILKESVLKADFDCIFAVDGYERYGKSVLALQVCKYLDHDFDMGRVCFTAQEFTKAVKEAKKFQAILYDEAITGLTSRTALGVINTALVKMLAQIGQKNLFVGIVMPAFFDLDKYVSLWRSMFLLHVYVGENLERGFFSFYNKEKKKSLWVQGKKTYSYRVSPNFFGRFTKHYAVNEKEYRKKKLSSLARKKFDISAQATRFKLQRNALIYALAKHEGVLHKKIADYLSDFSKFDMKRSHISTIIRDFAKEYEELGGGVG